MLRVSIIGTAGRKEDARKMSPLVFQDMCDKAVQHIEQTLGLKWADVHLVSGGAPWADHVAVELYLRKPVGAMTLYLPAALHYVPELKEYRFVERPGAKTLGMDAGRVSNYYHAAFAAAVKPDRREPLREIERCSQMGATIDLSAKGFSERNKQIARCDHMLAFTWAVGQTPKPGGTKQTWDMCTGAKSKVHVHIGSLPRQPSRRSASPPRVRVP